MDPFEKTQCKIIHDKRTKSKPLSFAKNRKKYITGDFFGEWNKITSQIHIRKFEELMT